MNHHETLPAKFNRTTAIIICNYIITSHLMFLWAWWTRQTRMPMFCCRNSHVPKHQKNWHAKAAHAPKNRGSSWAISFEKPQGEMTNDSELKGRKRFTYWNTYCQCNILMFHHVSFLSHILSKRPTNGDYSIYQRISSDEDWRFSDPSWHDIQGATSKQFCWVFGFDWHRRS